MATIRKEIVIDAPVEWVWDAVRDVGALHTRLVPGLVTDTRLEDDARIVTFATGLVLRERIVAVDDDARRLVWSVVGPPFAHHNGSVQVLGEGGGSRVVWVADLLPDDLSDTVAGIMAEGLAVTKRTLEGGERTQTGVAPHSPVFGVHTAGVGLDNRRTGPVLHHVSLFVADIEASTRFYTVGLGLALSRKFEDIVVPGQAAARFGVASVFLDAGGGGYVELHPAGGGPMVPPGFPLHHFALFVDDVDAAYTQAMMAGARRPPAYPLSVGLWDGSPLDVVMDGADPEPIRMAFLLGPDGELIELCQAAPPQQPVGAG